MSHVDITVAICTYNGANRVRDVLDALCEQSLSDTVIWEVLVIDNASQDNIRQVIYRYKNQPHCNYPLRYTFEAQQGLAFARLHAVAAAKGVLVAFLDDDNIPTQSWVNSVVTFAQSHPQVGAFGGKIKGQYEVPPPEGFERIAGFLAIIDRGELAHCYTPQNRMLPPGAGLVVRRAVWLEHVPKTPTLTGRSQTSLLAGEDLEVLAHIQKAGWEIWYNPEMVIYHKIPKSRLEEPYLLKLAWGIGLCRHHIRIARYRQWQAIALTPLHIVHDGIKVLKLVLHSRHSNATMLSRKFELNYQLATFYSPFYWLFNSLKISFQKPNE
ncbi:MAG: hormogonium polysaccharide biosynthesis glycosyltransferase HpsE [Leptolyngbyaceae cyanobacterium]